MNVHNHFLLDEIKSRSGDEPDELEQDFMFALALLGMSFLVKHERISIDLAHFGDEEGDILDFIPHLTRTVAPVIIPLVRDL